MTTTNGFYLVHGTNSKLHYAVDIKTDYAGLNVFEVLPENWAPRPGLSVPKKSWAELEAELSIPPEGQNREGLIDVEFEPVLVEDLPGTSHGGLFLGRSYFFTDGMVGYDEIVDYTIIDILTGKDGKPMPWRNRFAGSAKEKIDFSWRFRAANHVANCLVVFMPFATTDLTDTRIELLCNIDPILLNATTTHGRVDVKGIAPDGQWFKQFFFHAETTQDMPLTVAPGGTIDVPFELLWNGGGACPRATRFKLEADAGYLPHRRVSTDAQGKGSFRFTALGLEAGDTAKVKLNAEHYTGIGTFRITVA